MGDQAAARQAFRQAVEIEQAAFGEASARMGDSYRQFGALLASQGDAPSARAAYQQALAILTASLPPKHPKIAGVKEAIDRLDGLKNN